MDWMNALEQTPRFVERFVKSMEALGPYLRDVDFSRVRGWMPGSRTATPWPAVAAAFAAGMVVGAGAALMTAPTTGAELRAQLKSKLAATRSRVTNGRGQPQPEERADLHAAENLDL